MSWLLTYTGKRFDPTRPDNQIDIVDIAHALSHIARFAGHTEKLYSVAQHSVIVSGILKGLGYGAVEQLEGLLHDASEAYLCDIPSPIKHMPVMLGYRELEKRVQDEIYRHFGIQNASAAVIKHADLVALAAEARDLMGNPQDWAIIRDVKPLDMRVVPLTPTEAKALFLERFLELTTEVNK